MWQRFTAYDLRVIGHYLGTLIMLSSIAMAVPFVTALCFQEWEPAGRYLLATGISLAVGAGLRFLRVESVRLNRRQALAVTGLAWIILAFFASVPLYYSGHFVTYLDALFDGVSGYTTTGASIIVDLDHLSYADNMFRFVMHLVGGLGLISIALSIGLFGKQSSSGSLFTSEGRTEHVVPNVVQTIQFIAKVMFIGIFVSTIIVGILCLVAGMDPVRAFLQAFWLSISGMVTGGFTPMSFSVMYYHSFPIEFVLMVLMILGSISFALYFEAWRANISPIFKDTGIRTMCVWLIIVTLVFTASMTAGTMMNDLPDLLRRGLFMVLSSFSTTGFQTVTTNQLTTMFTSGAFLVLALTMAIGGCAGSTAGGIKIFRVSVIFKSIYSTIKETLAPDTARVVVTYHHQGRHVLTADVVKEATTVSILYVVTYVLGTLVGIAHGFDASEAMFESIAMASNSGIITGLAAPGMAPTLELFYILEMWAGRLEFVTLLAIIFQLIISVFPNRARRRS